jgi:O-acetyl-ADP-ribose deacetylase (regulator of RNase III)
VAGAIRVKGGPQIQAECRTLAPVQLGGVAVTGAGALPQRFVIHAATMHLGQGKTSAEIVASCTRHALEAAAAAGCESIAFPALGTGVAGLDPLVCAQAMIRETLHFDPGTGPLRRVKFVLYDADTTAIFKREWDRQRLPG